MTETVVDVAARAIGFDPPRDGLLGSGLSKILAYARAADVVRALGLPLDLPAEKLRRWAAGEVTHIAGEATVPRLDELRRQAAIGAWVEAQPRRLRDRNRLGPCEDIEDIGWNDCLDAARAAGAAVPGGPTSTQIDNNEGDQP